MQGREMKITVDVIGEKEIAQAMNKLCAEKKRKIKGEVYASAVDVQREAREKLREMGTWDLGNLANTTIVDLIASGLIAEIGPTAPYGPYVEYGTKKHFPPPDALEGWAKRHGFDSAWPICRAIAKRGLKPRPFLFPAFLMIRDKFWKRIKEILEK